jgi:hypothetical protein
MLRIIVDSQEDIVKFLSEEKGLFYDAIVKGIRLSIRDNLNQTIVADFLKNDNESILSIGISESDWYESLYLALYYFEEEDEYEKCDEIKKLIFELYDE